MVVPHFLANNLVKFSKKVMKASRIDNRQEELFQPRLSGQLNQKNELMILSRLIPWDSLGTSEQPTNSSPRN